MQVHMSTDQVEIHILLFREIYAAVYLKSMVFNGEDTGQILLIINILKKDYFKRVCC